MTETDLPSFSSAQQDLPGIYNNRLPYLSLRYHRQASSEHYYSYLLDARPCVIVLFSVMIIFLSPIRSSFSSSSSSLSYLLFLLFFPYPTSLNTHALYTAVTLYTSICLYYESYNFLLAICYLLSLCLFKEQDIIII